MKLGFVFSFIIAYLLWLFFNMSLGPQTLMLGVPVVLMVAAMSSRFVFGDFGVPRMSPLRIAYAIRYSVDFLVRVFNANISMAKIILQPKLDIIPVVIRIPLRTNSDCLRTCISNSITLTPGSLTLDADDEFIYVHWVRATELDSEKAKEIVVGNFERYLKGVFE